MIKNVSTNKWKVEVSKRVSWAPYPVKKKATVKGTKTEAKLKEAELIRALETALSGSLTVRPAQSTYSVTNFGDAISLYKGKLKAAGNLSVSYGRKMEWVRRELGHLSIEGMAENFRDWLQNFINTPAAKGTKRSAGTINLPIKIVKAVMGHLSDLGVIEKNPITKAMFPKGREKPRDAYLSEAERQHLLKVIEKERPYILPIVKFMMQVPCRVSELVSANRDQLRNDTIYIPTSKNGEALHKPVPLDMLGYFSSIPEDCPYLFYRKTATGKYRPLTRCLSDAWGHCRRVAGFDFFAPS